MRHGVFDSIFIDLFFLLYFILLLSFFFNSTELLLSFRPPRNSKGDSLPYTSDTFGSLQQQLRR